MFRLLVLAAAAATLFAAPASAQSSRYVACLEKARSQPAAAREEAAQWEALGGGAEAKHCAAIALIGVGAEGQAAKLLTEVGVSGGGLSAEDRAGALLLAGDIWLRIGRMSLAAQTYDRAAKLSPQSREPLVGQAKAAAGLGDYAAAKTHLDAALALRANDPEALILRAAAHRRLDDNKAALADAEAALALNKGAPVAWFEKGAAQKALGDAAGAKDSWIIASQLDPVGPAGDLAREGLQLMILGE